MSDDREHRVRTRAYHIWERDGRAGRAEDHWLEAEAEIGRESDAPAAAPPEQPSPEQPKKPARRGAASTLKADKTPANASEKPSRKPAADRGQKGVATKTDAPRPRRTPPA